MRILHLSDLHVTHDGRTLDELWLVAERAIRDQTFDFVVITGDLTQRAQPEEYEQLHKFLERRIEPRVVKSRGPIKPRIVLVPGNHDVDWSQPVYEPLPLTQATANELESWFDVAHARPELEPFRVHTSGVGHRGLFRIIDAAYPSRFAAVDTFLTGYYGAMLGHPHKPFDLLDPTGNGDWSAHVFPHERVAFLGFNSCHRNDRYWHGAYIHHAAIRNAKDHLDALPSASAPGQVRVAVWHHGLESHRSRPDRLTLDNLGVLLSTGAKVGFHGHVHESIAQIHRFITDDFALVSTGSLGSASPERPDAVGNQFSTVVLHWNRLRTDVFERQSRLGQYEKRRTRYMYFDFDRPDGPEEPIRSWAQRVSRRVTLDADDGVATIEIEIDGLYLTDPIVLARFDRQLCGVGEARATVDGELLEIADVETESYREFRFLGRTPTRRYGKLRWSYRIANALAVTRAELELLSNRKPRHPHIHATQEVWSHVVQFDHDELELTFRHLPANRESAADYILGSEGSYDVTPIVERALDGGWERVTGEESRARLDARASGFDLAWSSPMAGHRYGAMFRLATAGALVSRDDRARIEQVAYSCRSSVASARLRELLATTMFQLVRAVLEVPLADPFGEHLVGVGYLWSNSDRVLRTCFGEFPADAWATEFHAGRGIAGHAFRFDRPAAWHRDAPGDFDVIKAPTLPGSRDYRWILCLPLLADPVGKSVGVVGFAATTNDSQLATELAELAQRIASGSNVDNERIDALWRVLNVGFWHALVRCGEESTLLARGVIDMATRSLDSFLAPRS